MAAEQTKAEIRRLRKRIAEFEVALRVIHTWATFEWDGELRRKQVLEDIAVQCQKVLDSKE